VEVNGKLKGVTVDGKKFSFPVPVGKKGGDSKPGEQTPPPAA
jgi:hypothetical protein